MNSKKNFLIVALALSTVICGALAWQQRQLAQGAMHATVPANEDLAKKLAAAERHAADLEARLAALQSAVAPDAPPAAPDVDASRSVERRGPDREGQNNRRAEMAALMNNPDVQKLMISQQKAQLDSRYATLFKQLALSPAQLETFKNLLLEKQSAQRDVMTAARETGLNPRENRDDLQKLVAEANAETDAAMIAAIGQDKFERYRNYEGTGSQRALVEQLDRTMSYSAKPLDDAQSQALVQILAQSAASTNTSNNQRGGGFGGPFGGNGARVTITDTMIAQAQSILSPDQVKVLQDQQAAQQNEQKLRELMRSQMPGNGPRSQ